MNVLTWPHKAGSGSRGFPAPMRRLIASRAEGALTPSAPTPESMIRSTRFVARFPQNGQSLIQGLTMLTGKAHRKFEVSHRLRKEIPACQRTNPSASLGGQAGLGG